MIDDTNTLPVARGATEAALIHASRRGTRDRYRSRAARFRRLAAEATTAQARKILLDLARQHDGFADGGGDTPADADPQR